MTTIQKGSPAAQDISNAEMSTTDMKPARGGRPVVRENADGTLESNIAFPKWMNHDDKQRLMKAFLPFMELKQDLTEAIDRAKANGQPNLATELEAKLTTFNNQLEGVKKLSETLSFPNDGTSMGRDQYFKNVGSGAMGNINKSGLPGEIKSLMGRVAGEAAGKGESFADEVGGTSAGDGASVFASDGDKGDWVSQMLADPDKAVAAFEGNPEDFFAHLKELDAGDRQAITMTLQNKIQQDNQLFSMLSNFTKAMHDTQKAVISNLRV